MCFMELVVTDFIKNVISFLRITNKYSHLFYEHKILYKV